MRIAVVIVGATSAAACASHIRTEVIGQAAIGIQPRNAAVTTAPPGIAVTPGQYEIAMSFDLPRAQLVDWVVRCPGATTTGTAGERFEAYRQRRLAELADERERQASVVSSVASAVMRPAGGTVRVRTTTAGLELPPGDVGARRVVDSVRVFATGDGTCALTATTDDPMRAGFQITRIRDLDAEKREVEIHTAATVEIEHDRAAAIAERMHVEALLIQRCGADPERRAHLVATSEAEDKAHGDVALHVRTEIRGRLVALGAVERTPMPEPMAEVQPPRPVAAAVWTAGAWTWTGARWTWVRGAWHDPRTGGAHPHVVKRRIVIRRPVVIVPVPLR